jgi:hypothetical protein
MTTPSAGLALVRGADWPWLPSAAQMAWRACRDWPDCAAGDWTARPKVAVRTPALDHASIGPARDFALATAQRWGVKEAGDDIAAVVSELLTNALRHALPQAARLDGPVSAWPVRLGLVHPGPFVVCAVADPSPQAPVLRQPDWLAESGRGLQVVAALAGQWGYCVAPSGSGKVVWAAVPAGQPGCQGRSPGRASRPAPGASPAGRGSGG